MNDIAITARSILKSDIDIDTELNMIIKAMTNFYDNQQLQSIQKIDSYVSTMVPIEETTPDILVIKERLIQLLKKKSSMKIKTKKHKYYIIKATDSNLINIFLVYSIFYHLDSSYIYSTNSTSKLSVGLDFEFDNSINKVALCQIGFYPQRLHRFIFIIDPKMMTDYQQELMINTIFTSDLIRIVHGADGLDIPYIFEDLFMRDSNKILKFTNTMIDIRYLCEYYKICTKHEDKKCSLYDALLYFKVINKKTYNSLNRIHDIISPVQDIQWNIHKLSNYHLKYVLYDVIYLKDLVMNIYSMSKNITPPIYEQLRFITNITRFIAYEKYGISSMLNTNKLLIDSMNNYFIHNRDSKTLIKIYNDVIQELTIPSLDMKISNLLEINGFKKTLTILFKKVIYFILTNKYTVYKTKKEKSYTKLLINNDISQLLDLKLEKLAILLERMNENAKTIIIETI